MIRCTILAVLLAALVAAAVHAQRPTVDQLDQWRTQHRALLDAIRQVESGGDDRAVGDGGNAIGAYQIWRAYHQDATEWVKALAGPWADCYSRIHAERIVVAYWHRYARAALRDGDNEVLARIHNGGPRGHTKQATLGYWTKVQRQLDG